MIKSGTMEEGEGLTQRRQEFMFQGDGTILCLKWSTAYRNSFISQNFSNCTLKMGVCILCNVTSIKLIFKYLL